MIQGASAVIVLIDQNTHNHSWVLHEIALAQKNKKLLVLCIDGTKGERPKSLSEHIEIPFDVNKIKNALSK